MNKDNTMHNQYSRNLNMKQGQSRPKHQERYQNQATKIQDYSMYYKNVPYTKVKKINVNSKDQYINRVLKKAYKRTGGYFKRNLQDQQQKILRPNNNQIYTTNSQNHNQNTKSINSLEIQCDENMNPNALMRRDKQQTVSHGPIRQINKKIISGIKVANVTLKNICNKQIKNYQKQSKHQLIEKLKNRRKSLSQKVKAQALLKNAKPRVYVKSMNNRKVSPMRNVKQYQLPKQYTKNALLIDKKKGQGIKKLIHRYVIKDQIDKQKVIKKRSDLKLDHSLMSDRSFSQQSSISAHSTKSQKRTFRKRRLRKKLQNKREKKSKQILNTSLNKSNNMNEMDMVLDCQEMLDKNVQPPPQKINPEENLQHQPQSTFTNYICDYKLANKKQTKTIKKKLGVVINKSKKLTEAEKKKLKDEQFKKDIDEFDEQIDNYVGIDSEALQHIIKSEVYYYADPYYFDKTQRECNWLMRAILFDWMQEVATEFTLKRETYHCAINYIDRYLTVIPNIKKWKLQLVGVTAMYIASKMEEVIAPKIREFARSSDDCYTVQQIKQMEMEMFKALKWKLTPPTLNMWSNWYMTQWDLFIETDPYAQHHQLVISTRDKPVQFKQPNEQSYSRYREFMQIIDCAIIDIQTLQYKPRPLLASLLYLLVGKYYNQFTVEQIFESFSSSSMFLFDEDCYFNELFQFFLKKSFGFQLIDLLPNIQYIATFFQLPMKYELPTAAKVNKEDVLEGAFEEFLAFQTHHPLGVKYVKFRRKQYPSIN